MSRSVKACKPRHTASGAASMTREVRLPESAAGTKSSAVLGSEQGWPGDIQTMQTDAEPNTNRTIDIQQAVDAGSPWQSLARQAREGTPRPAPPRPAPPESIEHHEVMAGTDASMAPGFEDAEALADSKSSDAYWAKA
jgi:hypothetical protein